MLVASFALTEDYPSLRMQSNCLIKSTNNCYNNATEHQFSRALGTGMILLSVLLAQATSPSWWEPGTPNFLDVGDMSAVFAFTLAVLGALSAVIKKAIKTLRAMIKEEISIATAPIHPSSNGGLSLPDVARRTKYLEEKMDMIYEMQQKNNKLYTMVVDKIMELETELEYKDEECD
jgi:hypothetical protein